MLLRVTGETEAWSAAAGSPWRGAVVAAAAARSRGEAARCDTGVCEESTPFLRAFACHPEAEAARQPLTWHSGGLSSQGYYFPEECFFTDTGMTERDAIRECIA